ncbi:hypothetical protein ACFRCQ_24220 [Cytobacillus firmus]|jgi:hypothetical protein|uniref:hypothetical protein n=1 Tax=Cytobacillus TaxID=2675230 RepID=UPI002117F83E|nr:hypothetical protein [Cytobacillus sp. Bac17]
MEFTLKEQIRRINEIDKNEKTIILIKAIESFLNISLVVKIVINKYTTQREDINNFLRSIGLEIIDEFRNQDNYIFFEKNLKKYCGFQEDDVVSSNIIFECCSEEKVDILKLKKELIDAANSLNEQKQNEKE